MFFRASQVHAILTHKEFDQLLNMNKSEIQNNMAFDHDDDHVPYTEISLP